MIRSAAGKVMWVGRATVFLVGLAVILALVFGAATTAFGANGNPFLLGKKNAASLLTKLTGNVNGAAMQVANSNAGADDTALSLSVQAGEAPMKVNSDTRVANLNAARAGRADTAASADAATNAQNAANADQLDGKSSEQFADGAGGVANNADNLDGKDSSDFLASGAAAPLKGYQVVSAHSPQTNLVTKEKTVIASCPSGKKAIGGGGDAYVVSTENRVAVVQSMPWNSGTAWRVTGRAMQDPFNSEIFVSAYAVCAEAQ